jgi:hypothetical protein
MDYYTSWQQQHKYKQQQQQQHQLYYQQYQINNLVPIASIRDYSDLNDLPTVSRNDQPQQQSYPDFYYYVPEPQGYFKFEIAFFFFLIKKLQDTIFNFCFF